MSTVDQSQQETARNSASLIFRALSEHGAATKAAEHLGLSEATISKFKSPDQAINVESVSQLLAFLGIKCVPADHLTVDPARYRALLTFAEEGFAALKGDAK